MDRWWTISAKIQLLFRRNSRFVALAVWFGTAIVAATAAHAQANCPLPGAQLIAPVSGATAIDTPVTFQWNAVAGATKYEVWGSIDRSDFEQLGTSTTTSLVAEITHGSTVEWYVVAANNDCKSESPHFRFTTSGCTGPAT